MADPRRVTIDVNRIIYDAWHDSVEQYATTSSEATEIARIETHIQLDEELAEPALLMLERVLAGEFEGFEAWERDGDQLRSTLAHVTLVYDTNGHTLNVETSLTESLSLEEFALTEVSGVAAEAIGRYYKDDWGLMDEQALEEAEASAKKKIAELIARDRLEQNAETLEQADCQSGQEAEEKLQARMTELRTETRAAIRARLQVTLAQAQERVHRLISTAIGEAFRQTLLQMVQENGGRVVTDEQTGSIVNMELELY